MKHTIPHIRYLNMVLLALLLFMVPVQASQDEDAKPAISEDLFENHGMPMLVIDSDTGMIIAANRAARDFYGYNLETLRSMRISDINVLVESEVQSEINRAVEEERNYFVFKHRIASGDIRTVEVFSYPVQSGDKNYLYSVIHDITLILQREAEIERAREIQLFISLAFSVVLLLVTSLLLTTLRRRKITQRLLIRSEEGYALLFDNMHEGYALHEIVTDDGGAAIDYKFLKVNKSFEDFLGLKGDEIVGKNVTEVIPHIERSWIDAYGRVALEGETLYFEDYALHFDRHFSVHAYNAGPGRFISVFIDISDKKRKEHQIQFLNNHDQLTGLYNRRYMEEKLAEFDSPAFLPLSIIMADVNGLKLSNDAFGHAMGDALLKRAASEFQKVFRDSDIITRVGGDEFLILLPNTSRHVVNQIVDRLRNSMKGISVGPVQLSVSFGDATKNSVSEEIQGVYKRAEDRMYHTKLTESHEVRAAMIHYIFDVVVSDYEDVDEHQNRVTRMAGHTWRLFGLSKEKGQKLMEAARYHDVGLVAIESQLANKPDSLTEDEWIEIKRHSECGYRILSAISEYAAIADIILAHHEWYDGSGYPKNLRGDEIPKLSRILTILDAYDAMTHPRVYKEQFSKERAISELKKFAGSQFDPALVEIFISYLYSENVEE